MLARRSAIRVSLYHRPCLRCYQSTKPSDTTTSTPTNKIPSDDSRYLSHGQLISTPSSFHVPQLSPEDYENLSRLPPYRNRWFTEYGLGTTTATTTAGIGTDWQSSSNNDSDTTRRKILQNTVIDFENAYFIPRVQKPIIRRVLFDEVHSASPQGRVVTVERAKAFAEANVTPLFAAAESKEEATNQPLEFRFVTGGYAYHSSKNPPRSILTGALPHALFAGPAAEQPVTLSDGSSTTIMKRASTDSSDSEVLNAMPIEAFDKLEFGDLTSMACGEDSAVGSTQLLGLADGVSGWSHRVGGHAALWSRLILHRTISHYVDNYNEHADTTKTLSEQNSTEIVSTSRSKDLLNALDDGFTDAKAILAEQEEIGSSTLILAALDQASATADTANLEVLNIGDSSIWVFRDGALVFTVEHAPKLENCPRQLGTNTTDAPSALVSPYTIPVRAGDIVLLSSDGVSDNLWINEITDILREKYFSPRDAAADPGENLLQRAADAIVLMATDRSFDNFAVCPYQLNAAPYSTGGGKTDDISVLLAEIVERPSVE
jgi:serine/threonine protein phosphatase PrpC